VLTANTHEDHFFWFFVLLLLNDCNKTLDLVFPMQMSSSSKTSEVGSIQILEFYIKIMKEITKLLFLTISEYKQGRKTD